MKLLGWNYVLVILRLWNERRNRDFQTRTSMRTGEICAHQKVCEL